MFAYLCVCVCRFFLGRMRVCVESLYVLCVQFATVHRAVNKENGKVTGGFVCVYYVRACV